MATQAYPRYTIRLSDPSELKGLSFGDPEAKEEVIDVDNDESNAIDGITPSRRRSSRQAAAKPSSTKRNRRGKRKTEMRLSHASPVFLEAQQISQNNPNAGIWKKLSLTSNSLTKYALVGAIQSNDALETIYSSKTMKTFKSPSSNVLSNPANYPLNLVFARKPGEPIEICLDDDESPSPRKRKRGKKPVADPEIKQPPFISLLSSDEEDNEDEEVTEETKPPAVRVASVSVDSIANSNNNDSNCIARPDPTPGYQTDEWVLTPLGPGRIESFRIDRFSDSFDSLVNPLLTYQVTLPFGALFVSAKQVQPFEGSPFANQVVISDDKLSLTQGDVIRLQPNTYLNDNLVNFFLRRLDTKNKKIHVFSSYFYTRIADLCQGQKKNTPEFQNLLWDSLKGWIKNVDIWDTDLLLIPIHDRLHWSLLVVYHAGLLLHPNDGEKDGRIPCLLHVDSGKRFRLHNSSTIFARMRVFLQVCLEKQHELQFKLDKTNVPGGSPPVPPQENETDCGMYMLEWMERLLEGELKVTQEFVDAKGDMAPFGKTAFPQSLIDKKRNDFQSLVYTLSQDGTTSGSG